MDGSDLPDMYIQAWGCMVPTDISGKSQLQVTYVMYNTMITMVIITQLIVSRLFTQILYKSLSQYRQGQLTLTIFYASYSLYKYSCSLGAMHCGFH